MLAVCVCVCVCVFVYVCSSETLSLTHTQSYIAAESEHLLAQRATIALPSGPELEMYDRAYFLQCADNLSSLLWLSLCLSALAETSSHTSEPHSTRVDVYYIHMYLLSLCVVCMSVVQWLPDMFPGVRVDLPGSHLQSTAIDTLSLPDIEVCTTTSVFFRKCVFSAFFRQFLFYLSTR